MFAANIENFKKRKISNIFKKTLSVSIVYSKCGIGYEKIFRKQSIKILKILALINNIEEYKKIYNNI